MGSRGQVTPRQDRVGVAMRVPVGSLGPAQATLP